MMFENVMEISKVNKISYANHKISHQYPAASMKV